MVSHLEYRKLRGRRHAALCSHGQDKKKKEKKDKKDKKEKKEKKNLGKQTSGRVSYFCMQRMTQARVLVIRNVRFVDLAT